MIDRHFAGLLAMLLALAMLAMLPARPLAAQEADAENLGSFDINAFTQQDGGGQRYKNESFDYVGFRFALKFKLSETVTWRGNAAVALILNHQGEPLPSTITNANITSASPNLLTLDTAVGFDIRPEASGNWTLGPGIYYHHQIDFLSFGADFEARGEFFGGNTVFTATYTFRFDYTWIDGWDGKYRGTDQAISHNFKLGLTQILSPEWKLHLSGQYSRQNGYLTDPFGYITLEDPNGVPVMLVDEKLPRERNRWQVNLRGRFSPEVGLSVGLDGSFYTDDWGILHGAIEPNIEIPFADGDVRWRVWYRIAIQDGTKYFRRAPQTSTEFQTQDSDLATFVLHSPGTLVLIALTDQSAGTEWHLRVSLFGIARTDGIYAIGGNIGAVATW